MDLDLWQIIVALGFPGAIGSWLLKDKIIPFFNTKKAFQILFERRMGIYDLIGEIRREVKSPRVLILYTENGGGIPNAASKLYVSILYESIDSDVKSIKRKVQKYDIDEAYHRMLSSLLKDGEYSRSTKELEHGMLKSFYHLDGITRTFIVPLVTSDKKFFFMSVAWREEPENLEDAIITIKPIANNIKNILKKDM